MVFFNKIDKDGVGIGAFEIEIDVGLRGLYSEIPIDIHWKIQLSIS